MDKKIIVIGAGQGGLQAAKVLSAAGNDVTVFEKCERQQLGHDQLDVVEADFFDEMGIKIPDKAKKAAIASFIPPFSEKSLLIPVDDKSRDWSIERRIFSKEQVEECEKTNVKFVFGSTVRELLFCKDSVVGAVVDGEKHFADLVIDASGVFSQCRQSFKGKFGITENPEKNEVFNIVHTYYSKAEGVPDPDLYKYYLKYNGSQGICWCGIEVDDTVSTLIGEIGELTEEKYKTQFARLKEDNPIIGDAVLRGGHFSAIPVRYPAPIMVANGYASVGDSAFMTMPLLGNGIASAIRAGQMLADCIIAADSVAIDTLWKYETIFFKKYGALFCFIDFIKRGLLKCNDDDLKHFFETEVVSNDDLKAVFSGHIPQISPNVLVDKFKNAFASKKAFGTMGKYAAKGVKAMAIAFAIPSDYDISKIYKWKSELEKLYK